MSRARFGLFFNEQLVEQFRDVVVDVFRAIVRVKAFDDEREAVEQRFEYGDQERLTEGLAYGVRARARRSQVATPSY